MKPDCVIRELVHNGEKLYEVREIPKTEDSDVKYPNCTMCVAVHQDSCDDLPNSCSKQSTIFIRPEDLQKYKVAYTIARVSQ